MRTITRLVLSLVLLAATALAPLPAQGGGAASADARARAEAAFSEQDWPGAVAALRELVAAEPESGTAWYRLGYALHVQGKLEEALAAHEKAAEFDDGKRLGSYNAGCALALMGETDAAFEWLFKAVEAGFVLREHAEADEDLKSLRADPRFARFLAAIDRRVALAAAGRRTVAILVHDGVELLDFAGPGEVFSAARAPGGDRAFDVFLVSESTEPVTSQGFVQVTPQYAFDDCPKPDLIVLPGGATGRAMENEKTMAWIARAAPEAELVLSVCTGALLLAKAGLLDGLEATTHHGSIGYLTKSAPDTVVHTDARFVDNGQIVTSAGVSAGIDGALHVVRRLLGDDAATRTARYMEYDWTVEGSSHSGLVLKPFVAPAAARTADAEPDGQVWVCPPCSVDCHDKTYDRPGTCENEHCGMKLIPQKAAAKLAKDKK